jgi:polar amino acid transport system substrate-binding protein
LRALTQSRPLVRRLPVATVLAIALCSLAAVPLPAGAAGRSLRGVYSAPDAALVPIALLGTTIQVATDASYPPDEWMQSTTMRGIDPDLLRAVATTLGLKYKESNVLFDNIIDGVRANKYQIGLSSFPDTKALEASANFVDYLRGGEALYASSSSNVIFKGLASLCGLIVGVTRGSVEQSDVNAEVAKCPGTTELTVIDFASDLDLYDAVLSGEISAGFVDSQEAGYLVEESKGALKLVGRDINGAPLGLATAKSPTGQEFARALRAALKTLVVNGTYQAILDKWGAGAGALPTRAIVLNGASF